MLSFIKNRRAQNADDFETWIESDVSPTLNVFDNAGDVRATVLIIDGTRVGDVRVYDDEVMQTVISRWGTDGGNVPLIQKDTDLNVRRLTPRECERLQGFPDDWTVSQSDTQRFKQMGNAVTVNVIEWIGKRLMEANDG
jgi:DNA (cytosine-5)-methyltransferase 1